MEQNILIYIDEQNKHNASVAANTFTDKNLRNRAYYNTLGAEILLNYLRSENLAPKNNQSIHSIRKVLEEFDISDIMLEGIHIDIRVVFDENVIFVPKSHFEYEILPDIYVVLKLSNDLDNAEVLGFFEPQIINKNNQNSEYYFVEKEKLSPSYAILEYINNNKKSKNEISDDLLEDSESLILSMIDNDIANSNKKKLLKNLFKSNELLDKFIKYETFENLSYRAMCDNTIEKSNLLKDTVVQDEFEMFDELPAGNESDLIGDNQTTTNEQQIMNDFQDDNLSDVNSLDIIENIDGAAIAGGAAIADAEVLAQDILTDNIANDTTSLVADVMDTELATSAENSEDIIETIDELQPFEELPLEPIDELTPLEEPQVESLDELTPLEEVPAESLDELTPLDEVPAESLDELTPLDEAPAESLDELTPLEEVPAESLDELTPLEEAPAESLDELTSTEETLSEPLEELFVDNSGLNQFETLSDIDFNTDSDTNMVIDNSENIYDTQIPDNNTQIVDNQSEGLISFDDLSPNDSYDNNETISDFQEPLMSLSDEYNTTDASFNDLQSSELPDTIEQDDTQNAFGKNLLENLYIEEEGNVSVEEIENALNYNNANELLDTSQLVEDSDENAENTITDTIETQIEQPQGLVNSVSNIIDNIQTVVKEETEQLEYASGDEQAPKESLDTIYDEQENVSQEVELNTFDDIEDLPTLENGIPTTSINNNENKKTGSKTTLVLAVLLVAVAIGAGFQFLKPKPAQEAIVPDKIEAPMPQPEANIPQPTENVVPGNNNSQPNQNMQEQPLTNTPPAPSSTSATMNVSKIVWDVPDDIANDNDVRSYLRTAGKSIKISLSTDLLDSSEYAYAQYVKINLDLTQDGNINSANVVSSSGSTQIDNIVLQSVKDTLKRIKPSTGAIKTPNFKLSIIIYF